MVHACKMHPISLLHHEIAIHEEKDVVLPLEKQQVVMEPIKDDEVATERKNRLTAPHASTTTRIKTAQGRKVDFASKVAVKAIPCRHDYSKTVRRSYWADRKEMSMMTERNMIEFASEGWDWRNVREDDQMILLDNGQIMHPVHTNPYLCDALQRNIPYPRAVTPPEEDQRGEGCVENDGPFSDHPNDEQQHHHYQATIQCEIHLPQDRGAVAPDAVEMERPSSPFVESVALDQSIENFDEVLLLTDPDEFLRQRFSSVPGHPPYQQDYHHHYHQPSVPTDVYFNHVVTATTNLKI